MMTAHLHLLSCIPAAVRSNPRYVGDHVIRHYRPLGLAALLRDLALPPQDSFTIVGGIGTLTLYADGREDWKPTIPGSVAKPSPPPRPADSGLATSRRAVCSACESWRDGRCSAAGCGCAGEGKSEVWSSRCPLGKWPSIDCNP